MSRWSQALPLDQNGDGGRAGEREAVEVSALVSIAPNKMPTKRRRVELALHYSVPRIQKLNGGRMKARE